MIELNLLPPDMRRKKARMTGVNIPLMPICAFIVVFLLALHGIFIFLNTQVKNRYRGVFAEWDEMAPQKNMTDRLLSEIDALEKRVNSIRTIALPDMGWTVILDGLNQAVIPDIWLTEFRSIGAVGSGKGIKHPESIALSGYALGESEQATRLAGGFIKSLEDTEAFFKNFSEIELQDVTSRTVDGEKTMAFRLICKVDTAKSGLRSE